MLSIVAHTAKKGTISGENDGEDGIIRRCLTELREKRADQKLGQCIALLWAVELKKSNTRSGG